MKVFKLNKCLTFLFFTVCTLLLSGCDSALLDPKGQIGIEERNLIYISVALMLIVVIPVMFMAVYFARKYRAENIKAEYLPNWAHSNKIEVAIWGVPIVIIIILGIITWKSSHSLDPYRPLEYNDKKPLTIEVISLDWKWLFIYPEQGIATINEIAFPKDTAIEFKITSDSVMNSFFIPRLGSQIYAMAGMQTKVHLIANEAGTYDGISANYSGAGFSGMKFKAIATEDDAGFERWVNKVKESNQTLDNMDVFNQLAQPTRFHKVEYFSSVKPNLFVDIISKYGMQHQHSSFTPHQKNTGEQHSDRALAVLENKK